MEKITAITAAISAIIGVIVTIYKMLIENDKKRVEKYYEEILKPFIVEYHKNKSINVNKFLNKKAERSNDAIPKYIFYLKDKGEDRAEDLTKILLVDYLDIYPNDKNKIMNFFEMISRLVGFSAFVMSFTLWVYGAFCLIFSLIIFLQFLLDKNSLSLDLFGMSIFCFIFSIAVMQITRSIDYDMYTLKEKEVQRIIERKIKYFGKNSTKYIF